MKVVHAITRLNVGGAALSVLELAAEQQRRGADVLVVAGVIPPGEASMEGLAAELQLAYRHLPTLQRELSPVADARSTATLRQIVVRERPDVLHTHTAKAGSTGRIAAVLARRARPRAVVHTYHGHVLRGYFDPRRERTFRFVERTLAHVSDGLVAVSTEVRDDLVRLAIAPLDKFTVIPYGFDLDERIDRSASTRAAKRAAIGAGADEFVIGWAGRLTAIKRPLDLVAAAARVPGSRLVLAGDGELRGAVESAARELGIHDRVTLLGYVSDMGAWYGAFDAFLLTSANEGTPVVAIEALAAGVPVVATDAGGTRTVVSGPLARIGDVDALARSLTALRDDPELRRALGEQGAEEVRRRFSTARMVDDVERLYTRILGR